MKDTPETIEWFRSLMSGQWYAVAYNRDGDLPETVRSNEIETADTVEETPKTLPCVA